MHRITRKQMGAPRKGSVFHVIGEEVFIEVKGGFVVVDKSEFDSKGLHKYTFNPNSGGYVKTWADGKSVGLHQLVLGKVVGLEIDHIDGNKLDNRRANLRHTTHQQNCWNKEFSSGYQEPRRVTKPWRVVIRNKGKNVFDCFYPSKTEAFIGRKQAEKQIFGEFSRSVL